MTTTDFPAIAEAGFETFPQAWANNQADPEHPAIIAGIESMQAPFNPEAPAKTVSFTDVSLRDGLQQRTNETTVEERIQIFDKIIETGVTRIEIGHLGNQNVDQEFATALIGHIANQKQIDPRYEDLELQVLFGTQKDKIEEGSDVLKAAYKQNYPETWEEEMAKSTVVHVYDRIDSNLLNTASKPYSVQESARRVTVAANTAIENGFTKFSISGEATTASSPEDAIQYYRAISATMFEDGANSININLPNTYGYSKNQTWNTATMAVFNAAVKHGFDGNVTTSIHSHNDVDNALEITNSAIVAGFDYVEGTLIGTGERSGNTANIDVMARIVEAAKHQIDLDKANRANKVSRIAMIAGAFSARQSIKIDPRVVAHLGNWYSSAQAITEIMGEHAEFRFRRSSVGNPYAHDNGSGPHDQAMAAAVTDPIENPGDKNYEWALMVNNILGRPGTKGIAIGDPEEVDKVTVGNHAGGGYTAKIKSGELTRPNDEIVDEASKQFDQRKSAILNKLTDSIVLVA